MKYLLIILCSVFVLTGCATSTYKFGTDFSSENVSKIVKGETTSSDLLYLFGQPFTKSVISETDEKWVYSYSETSAKAQSYVFSMDVKTSGVMKSLDVLVRDGVVINFAYTEGPIPSSMTTN